MGTGQDRECSGGYWTGSRVFPIWLITFTLVWNGPMGGAMVFSWRIPETLTYTQSGVRWSSSCSISDIENKVIHQDFFSCIDFLPDSIIDLAIIDPPYNLSKKFGDNKFSKTTNE